jgi:hypothetical protein
MENFYETFKDSYVQLFDDRKYWKEKPELPKYSKVMPMRDLIKNRKAIKKLNDVGVGVFFTPNPCKNGRKESNVTSIKWVYIDMDSGTKEEQKQRIKESPIYPSIIIESLRSYHCYWRCDIEPKNFKDLIDGLILYFNGDPAITSSNEVLRVPGFLHQKYKDASFEIKLLKFDTKEESYEDLTEAYPKPMDSWKRKYKMKDSDLSVLKDIPIKTVLDRLGIQYSNKNEILEAGEITSAIINDKQNYVNRFSGKPPSGSTIDLAMHYNNTDVKGAIEWLKETFLLKDKSPTRVEIKKKTDYRKRYTWGTHNLDHTFAIIKRDTLTVLYGSRGQGKTTYIFDMATKNAKLGHNVLLYSLEMEKDAIISDLCRKYAGITVGEEFDYKIPEHKQEAYDKKTKELQGEKNLIFEGMRKTSDKTWGSILEGMSKHEDVDLIIIDNLDLISGDRNESNNDKQIRIIKNMMTFVSENKVPIILLHHQRKFTPGGKSSGMDDMSGSGKVPDTADYVVRVIRDSDPTQEIPERYKTMLHLEKSRGYSEEMEAVYFHRGSFVDEYPVEKKMPNFGKQYNF